MIEEEANVGDDADGLAGAAVADFGRHSRVDIDADNFHPTGEHVAGGDGVQHGAQAEHKSSALQLFVIGVLRLIHVGDGIGEWAVVAEAAGEDEWHAGFDAFVHHTRCQPAGIDGALNAAGVIDGVDGAHVIAVAVFFQAAVDDADAEGSAEEGGFNVMNGEGVATEKGIDPAVADELGERPDASGVNDDGAGDDDDFFTIAPHLFHDGGGLADGGIDLALRGDLVAHEGEAVAVTLLGFGDDADAAHANDDGVAGLQIAETAADGCAIGEHDHGVHALAVDGDPGVADTDFGTVIGGGIEIFGSAEILFDDAGFGVAIVGGSASEADQLAEEIVHLFPVGGFDFQTQMGGVGVGTSDLENLNFEASLEFDDGVEDALHDVGVD